MIEGPQVSSAVGNGHSVCSGRATFPWWNARSELEVLPHRWHTGRTVVMSDDSGRVWPVGQ